MMGTVPAPAIAIPVVIIDADPAIRHRLAVQVGEHAIPMESVQEAEGRLDGSAMVMVLGPSCALPGLAGAEAVLQQHREVGAILISDERTSDRSQRALQVGVRDVLEAPVDAAQLNEVIQRVVISLEGGPLGDDLADLDEAGPQAKVITVFSPKGGAGKSVVASNLAVLLVQRSEKPVVLVDADLQFGDIAVMLKLTPRHTIVDAVSSIDQLDAGRLQNLLAKHNPSGLFVLPAPLEPAFADQIGVPEMHKIMTLLGSFAAYVVVDTPAYLNDVVLSLMEESDDVLVVTGMDIPNIKNVKVGLQALRLCTPMPKVHLVLNRANSKVKLDVSEVERTLQLKAESQLPSEIAVPQSINKGMPVVIDSPRSGITKALEQLADLFCTEKVRRRKK